MATEKQTVKAEEIADALREDGKATKKAETFYFKNRKYSGLKVLVRGGTDALGQLGIKKQATFTAYYDTWKGDVVRVGYLATTDPEIAEVCRKDSQCEEISEKEYNLDIVGDEKNLPLRPAPNRLA